LAVQKTLPKPWVPCPLPVSPLASPLRPRRQLSGIGRLPKERRPGTSASQLAATGEFREITDLTGCMPANVSRSGVLPRASSSCPCAGSGRRTPDCVAISARGIKMKMCVELLCRLIVSLFAPFRRPCHVSQSLLNPHSYRLPAGRSASTNGILRFDRQQFHLFFDTRWYADFVP